MTFKNNHIYLTTDTLAVKNGGPMNGYYSTFQNAYNAANAIQSVLGTKVTLFVQNVTAAESGNLLLTANYNSNITIVGESKFDSNLGNITVSTSTFTVSITCKNVTIGNITTEGQINLIAEHSTIGNLTTSSTTGTSGSVIITNSLSSTIGNITATTTTGATGSISISGTGLIIGNLNNSCTSTIADFSVGSISVFGKNNVGSVTSTKSYASGVLSLGGFSSTETTFSGIVAFTGYVNTNGTSANVNISGFTATNCSFSNNVNINSRVTGGGTNPVGGTVTNFLLTNCNFTTLNLHTNATTQTTLNNAIIRNCYFGSSFNCSYSLASYQRFEMFNCQVGLINGGNIAIYSGAVSNSSFTVGSFGAIIKNVTINGACYLDIGQDPLTAPRTLIDDIALFNIHATDLFTSIVDGDINYNFTDCSCNRFVFASSSTIPLTKRTKVNNCNFPGANIGGYANGNILLTIYNSLYVISDTTGNQRGINVIAYNSTFDTTASSVGVTSTLAGSFNTCNVIRRAAITSTATLNNSFETVI